MQSNLRLSLRRSRRLAALLAALHGAAVAALWLLTFFPVWIRIGAAAGLIASLMLALRGRALLQSPGAVVELDCRSDGTLGFVQRDGECFDATVLADSAVHPLAVLLRMRVEGERSVRSVLVLADSLAAEEFRQLRVWMRWKVPPAEA